MTDRPRRQRYLLAGLVIVLAIVVYLRWPAGVAPDAQPAPQAGTTATPSNQATRSGGPDVPVADVKLNALQQPDGALSDAERNPFRFQPKAQPAAPPRGARQAPVETFVPPPAPTGPPPPPPIPLRYVGLIGGAAPADRVAVLSDARGNPYYGKEGDIIDGRYRVLRIATDSVEVAYADGRGRQTLRFSAQ